MCVGCISVGDVNTRARHPENKFTSGYNHAIQCMVSTMHILSMDGGKVTI